MYPKEDPRLTDDEETPMGTDTGQRREEVSSSSFRSFPERMFAVTLGQRSLWTIWGSLAMLAAMNCPGVCFL